jgi:hypothetical protein
VKTPTGWARLQVLYDVAIARGGGPDDDLLMMVYTMERNRMIKSILLLFAGIFQGKDAIKGLDEHLDDVLNLVDERAVEASVELRKKVSDAWLNSPPFKGRRVRTFQEVLAEARRKEKMRSSAIASIGPQLKDSILLQVPT